MASLSLKMGGGGGGGDGGEGVDPVNSLNVTQDRCRYRLEERVHLHFIGHRRCL